ncbi:MAG TPA: TIGR03067 domain-containing protein [Gemmataceae bacterium]|jgi:uncharacterized protein (TIGR03067 family)|nr:TIGR03067 domain-containing protein [Gemmataceae bacterium]
MHATALILAAALFAAADDKPKDDASAKDVKALQGRWKAVSGVEDGKDFDKETAEALELIVEGDKYTLKVKGEELEQGTLKLDAGKKPKAADIDIAKGEDKGKKQLGVYELSGDTFKLCVSRPGKERPKDLSAKKGSGHSLFVFKRAQ